MNAPACSANGIVFSITLRSSPYSAIRAFPLYRTFARSHQGREFIGLAHSIDFSQPLLQLRRIDLAADADQVPNDLGVAKLAGQAGQVGGIRSRVPNPAQRHDYVSMKGVRNAVECRIKIGVVHPIDEADAFTRGNIGLVGGHGHIQIDADDPHRAEDFEVIHNVRPFPSAVNRFAGAAPNTPATSQRLIGVPPGWTILAASFWRTPPSLPRASARSRARLRPGENFIALVSGAPATRGLALGVGHRRASFFFQTGWPVERRRGRVRRMFGCLRPSTRAACL